MEKNHRRIGLSPLFSSCRASVSVTSLATLGGGANSTKMARKRIRRNGSVDFSESTDDTAEDRQCFDAVRNSLAYSF